MNARLRDNIQVLPPEIIGHKYKTYIFPKYSVTSYILKM